MPRKVRITTTSYNFAGTRTVEQNLEQVRVFLDTAGAEHADLVCLPEAFNETGVSRDGEPHTEPLTGDTFAVVSEMARKHRTWVVASYCVRMEDGSIENSAVAVDRRGEVAGRYGKIYPTIGECVTRGITPGAEATIVDTDFGRMGLAICYDIGYPEYWQELGKRGAELVVWPSAYDGGFPLQAYAWMHSYYVVSSVRSEHSRVIDVSGDILASTSRWHRIVTETIDLEKEVFHVAVCLGQHEKLFQLQEELGNRVTLRGFSSENIVTLESNDPDWPVVRLKQHYGLLNFKEYHDHSADVQNAHRARLIPWGRGQVPKVL